MDGDWRVKEIIEPASGKTHRLYSYKRKPCRRVLLNSRLVDQLSGYVLIEKDLRNVLVWLKEIEKLHVDASSIKGHHYAISPDRERYNLIKGLFVAALTFYGKCFSKCDARPVKLEQVQLNERYHALHDDCISYRHNFAAHSGAKKLEYVEIALVYPQKLKPGIEPRIYRELYQPDLLWPSGEDISLVELVEHVRSVANAKIVRLEKKILEEEVIPKGFVFWRKQK